ncbi:MAG: hypothetical protein ACRDJG_09645 [Actinomycetota bacterium]
MAAMTPGVEDPLPRFGLAARRDDSVGEGVGVAAGERMGWGLKNGANGGALEGSGEGEAMARVSEGEGDGDREGAGAGEGEATFLGEGAGFGDGLGADLTVTVPRICCGWTLQW